jgi:bleomycin hydrolase
MYMMDEWFDEYLYEVIVRKEYLPPQVLKVLDTPPVLLPYWDPLSSLAKRQYRQYELGPAISNI